ncbi:MAG TPA: GNVR domain-containing protein [Gemmatimonadales bacterium]|jgi:uncharacterized protein involved in exopolysaccharide biosynthesis|nr:GNVR domain-containing protein [Gemmatimonadales bacterium]
MGPPEPNRDDPLFLTALTPFVRRWKLLVGLPLAAGVLGLGLSILVPSNYTAATTFTPEASSSTSLPGNLAGLVGLASQFGAAMPGAGADTPEFFAKVLTSRELLRSTLLSEFTDPQAAGAPGKRTLLSALDVSGDTESEKLNEGIRQFEKKVIASVDKTTGIVSLEVELRSADLAAGVANRMVELLNVFSLERLQLHSRAERRFAEQRLAQAQQELDAAEQRQLEFLQANRRYTDSPLLVFEADRLQRKVQLRQDVVLTLQREYEEARIAEVRDLPVLTIIDKATPPDKRSSPKYLLNVLVAGISGGLLAFALVYLSQSRAVAAQMSDEQYRAFQQAYREAAGEMRSLVGLKGGARRE